MAKKITTEIVTLGTPSIRLTNRANTKEEMQKYWCGLEGKDSYIGLGKFSYDKGKVSYCTFYRTDIMILQWFHPGICVFVEANGTYQTDLWVGAELEDGDELFIANEVKQALKDNEEFVKRQYKYLTWIQDNGPKMNGMTPEEAVEFLEKAGW